VLGLAGIGQLLMTGKLHLPVPALILAGPLYRGHGLFMLILFASTIALVGPAWCSHLCYIGAWDGVAAARTKPRGKQLTRFWLWGVRSALLAAVLAAALCLRWAGVSWLPAVLAAALFGLVGVGIMLVVSRRLGLMAHCTVFCPVGLCANLLGRINPFRVRIGQDCTSCGACTPTCRYSALSPEHIEQRAPGLSCTLCGDCIAACPHRQLDYGLFRLSPATARAAFVVLVLSLHAVFLGVARI
ncbi:MAG: 4Fe-4S binding protein, partial [Desulfovibrio sp.]